MENPRPEKVAKVEEVRERLSSASAAVLTEYRGLNVTELAQLRQSVREAGGEYRIYKNTLVRLAVRELGLDDLEQMLVGPTAIAFVEGDAVAVAKSLRDFSKTNPNLTIKGGVLGTRTLTAADAGALADVPPREQLLARLAGGLAAPLQQMAGLLQALPRNFAYGLSALVEKMGGVPEAPAEPEAVAAEAPAGETTGPEAGAAEAPAGETTGPEAVAAQAPAGEPAERDEPVAEIPTEPETAEVPAAIEPEAPVAEGAAEPAAAGAPTEPAAAGAPTEPEPAVTDASPDPTESPESAEKE